MKMSRRTVLRRMPAFTALAAGRRDFRANGDRTNAEPVSSTRQTQRGRLKRIATEVAFTIPELIEPMRDVLRRGGSNLDLSSSRAHLLPTESRRAPSRIPWHAVLHR